MKGGEFGGWCVEAVILCVCVCVQMLGPWLEKEEGTGVTGCFLRHGRKLHFLGL